LHRFSGFDYENDYDNDNDNDWVVCDLLLSCY